MFSNFNLNHQHMPVIVPAPPAPQPNYDVLVTGLQQVISQIKLIPNVPQPMVEINNLGNLIRNLSAEMNAGFNEMNTRFNEVTAQVAKIQEW
jgi:hypothetical protein